MLILTLNNIDQYKDIDVHDAEIGDLYCNYCSHSVAIGLKITKHQTTERGRLEFEKVKYVSMTIFEPWGEGIYVYKMTVEYEDLDKYDFAVKQNIDGCFLTTLTLNSGDKIEVLSEVLKYNYIQ